MESTTLETVDSSTSREWSDGIRIGASSCDELAFRSRVAFIAH